MDQFLSSLIASIAAIIGGLIAGIFSLYAVKLTNQHNQERLEKKEAKELQGLLQALHSEIESVFEHYQNTAGKYVENCITNKMQINSHYPIYSDYFTVYNENASLIGRIQNDTLLTLLVQTYAKAKSLIDSFKMNNEQLAKYEQLCAVVSKTNNEFNNQKATEHEKTLIEYSEQIKSLHVEVIKCVNNLLTQLKQEITSNQNTL